MKMFPVEKEDGRKDIAKAGKKAGPNWLIFLVNPVQVFHAL